jgi:hypothetical protein
VSSRNLQDIVHALNERRVTLRATEEPIDTRTAAAGGTKRLAKKTSGEGVAPAGQ